MKITRSRIPWLLFILLLFLSVTNSQKLGAADMSIVIGSVGYRERIMLPLDAVISIILEDVARIDVKAVWIGLTSFAAQGGPPWAFTLEYDPAKIHEKGRYALRAQIEANDRLLFTSTEHILAFDEEPTKPVEITVYNVSSKSTEGVAPSLKPNASLTNT
jgi:putative lipoprotein